MNTPEALHRFQKYFDEGAAHVFRIKFKDVWCFGWRRFPWLLLQSIVTQIGGLLRSWNRWPIVPFDRASD